MSYDDIQTACVIRYPYLWVRDPERARTVHDSHLARARWMTEIGNRLMPSEARR